MTVLVNHIGYNPGRRARAVIQGMGDEALPDSAVLRDAGGHELAVYPASAACTVAGWKGRRFCVVEFTAPEGGPYVLTASTENSSASSTSFLVKADIIFQCAASDLLYGLNVMRSSGRSDIHDRHIPIFGTDRRGIDVHGGWYDASGDTSKYLSHLSYSNFMNPQQTPFVVWALLDVREYLTSDSLSPGPRFDLRLQEEILWGADFLVRMQDPQGYFYVTVFDLWSKDLDERMICTFEGQEGRRTGHYKAGYRQGGGLAVAALARASTLPESPAAEYSPRDYRDAALRSWRHLEEQGSAYLPDGQENIIDDFCALLAASELFAAGVTEAKAAALKRAASLTGRWDAEKGCFRADKDGLWSWFHASDEALPLIALMRAVQTGALTGEAAEAALDTVRNASEAELHRCTGVCNPFLHPRRLVRMPEREESVSFFYPHENPSGYWWQGENSRLASWTASMRRLYHIDRLPELDCRDFADAQISWILGLNPFDVCMLAGRGRNNPVYEPDHFNVPGGVANGVTSGFDDEDDLAFLPPEAEGLGDHRWRWSEQWIPHAAWLLLAVCWSVEP